MNYFLAQALNNQWANHRLLGACAHPWNTMDIAPGTPRDEKSARTCWRPSTQLAFELVGSGETVLHPAATLITHGAALYEVSVFSPGPSFPAAKTTAIPFL